MVKLTGLCLIVEEYSIQLVVLIRIQPFRSYFEDIGRFNSVVM